MSESRRTLQGQWWVGVIVVVGAVALGWYMGSRVGDDTSPGDAVAPTDVDGEVHRDVAGRVVRLAPEDGVMTVDHEDIEGFMPAMVMDLQLADPGELEGLSPGDEILFGLFRNLRGWVVGLTGRSAVFFASRLPGGWARAPRRKTLVS